MKRETVEEKDCSGTLEDEKNIVGKEDYLDTLADKMEALGLMEEGYVNQLSERLEPLLDEPEKTEGKSASKEEIADSTKVRSFHKDPVMWLLLLLAGVAMSVILKGGFYTDDIILSYQSKYFIWDTGTDIRAYLGVVVQSWLNQGRFFPVSNIYVSLLMHYVSSPFVYKLLILLFVVLNVYAFGAFMRRLTQSRIFSLLAMAVVSVCLQIRAYHDGLIAYHLLMQVVLLLLLLTAMSLQQFLEKKKAGWLLVSLAPYTVGLLTYEAAYINIFLLCFLVFFYEAEKVREAFCWRNIKRTFFIILPYFLIMIGLFLATLVVKNKYGISYEGIQAEFSPGKVLVTTAKQAFASIPLSYHLFCNDNLGHIFHNNPIEMIKTAKIWDFLAAALLMGVSFFCLREKWKLKRTLSLLGMGLMLLFAPAGLIGISSRYQKELFWGIGHIPVYLEYFGITIVGVLLAGWLLGKLKKDRLRNILAGFCSFVLAFVLLVQMQDNRAVIDVMNDIYLYSRQLLDESLEAGVFSRLEDGSILLVENEALYLGYPGKEYFSYKTGKHLEVYRMEEFREKGYPENTPVSILSYEADSEGQTLTLREAIYKGNPGIDDEPGQTIQKADLSGAAGETAGTDARNFLRENFTVKSIYTWQKK